MNEEIEKRRTLAIISHPDAGKTTLTEKLLLYGGALELAGSVTAKKSQRDTASDWMELEKKRGISISSTVLQFDYAGYKFNDATNINYRLEFFDDKDGVAAFGSFGGANVFSNTMSLNYKVGNLTFIPEVRFDFASEKIYPTENNASKTNGSILFATTYSF